VWGLKCLILNQSTASHSRASPNSCPSSRQRRDQCFVDRDCRLNTVVVNYFNEAIILILRTNDEILIGMNVGNIAQAVDVKRPIGQIREGHLTGKSDRYTARRWQRRIKVILDRMLKMIQS
jgi:hypothetical protein